MNWFIWVMIAMIVYQVFKAIRRGWKDSILKLTIVIASLILSIVASSFMHNFNIGDLITINNGQNLFNFLPFLHNSLFIEFIQTVFFFSTTSSIITLILFLIINKLGIFLFTILSGLGKATEIIKTEKVKENRKIFKLISTIVIGVIIGILFVLILLAPMYEIYLELLI